MIMDEIRNRLQAAAAALRRCLKTNEMNNNTYNKIANVDRK